MVYRTQMQSAITKDSVLTELGNTICWIKVMVITCARVRRWNSVRVSCVRVHEHHGRPHITANHSVFLKVRFATQGSLADFNMW